LERLLLESFFVKSLPIFSFNHHSGALVVGRFLCLIIADFFYVLLCSIIIDFLHALLRSIIVDLVDLFRALLCSVTVDLLLALLCLV
jgi:hypothetical protein